MYGYFSDLHVDLLSKGLLAPGERRVGQTVTRYVPWWALGFINKTYLVIATDQRIIMVEHRMAWLHQAMKLHSVESMPWSTVQEARVTGLFGKKLRVRGQSPSGPVALKHRIPNPLFGLLAPMRNNVGGARAIEGAFQATRSLAAAPQVAALPPAPAQYAQAPYAPQAYAPPPSQVPYTPQAQSQAAYSQAPALPPQNAPGYTSVRPTPPSTPMGIAPTPPRSMGPRPPQV